MRLDEDEGLTLTELLDVLEEPSPQEALPPVPAPAPAAEPPTTTARTASLAGAASAAAPRIETAAREAVTAVGAVALLVLVPLAVLAVVTAEATAKVVTAADLPARGRSVADRIPGWGEELGARTQRAAQWVLGPQGIWTGRGPRRPPL